MKKLRFVLLALLLMAALAVPALADDVFNPASVTVSNVDDVTIQVTVSAGNAVLDELKPELAIPCDFEQAEVTGPDGSKLEKPTVDTLDGVRVVCFQVAVPGTYTIKDVTPAQENNPGGDNGGAGAGAGASVGGGASSGGAAAGADAVEIKTNEDGSVTVTLPEKAAGPVEVEIPAEGAGPGTVAVLVHEDGTEEILRSTRLTENGVAVTLEDSCTLKIIDNAKTFNDVPADNWAADAVAFVTARELFLGTGDDSFSPDLPMTRGMLMTVLARYCGADAYGSDWQEKGVAWAVENGISDGSAPEANVTREQIVVMLWRLAGSPAPAGDLSGWTDGGDASAWAVDALAWAVENGIMQGNGSGALNPRGPALRSHVAQLLMNFINLA